MLHYFSWAPHDRAEWGVWCKIGVVGRAKPPSTPTPPFPPRSQMHKMTIADLANAFRGLPRDTVILIETPDGPRRLRMVVCTRVAEGETVETHPAHGRVAVVLRTEG